MSVILPLAVWPYPIPPEAVEAIRSAKEWLCQRDSLEFKVTICQAVAGSPTRVLSFNGPGPFLADYAKMRNWRDPAEMRFWLEWVLDEEQDVEQGFTKADWLAWSPLHTTEITDPMALWRMREQEGDY